MEEFDFQNMSRFHRNAMHVNGIPMSYSLMNHFRDSGAVGFDMEVIDPVKYRECWEGNVLSQARYSFLVGVIDDNLELYRGMLKYYLSRGVDSAHPTVIQKLCCIDPGARVESYLLYRSELVLNYPCKVRGAALKLFIDEDLAKFERIFPRSDPVEMLRMIRGSSWIGLRL